MDNFYFNITLTFLLSGLTFLVMMRLQKKKEADAEWQYQFTLKSKGINPDLEIPNDSKNEK